jgi:hypothetical protein
MFSTFPKCAQGDAEATWARINAMSLNATARDAIHRLQFNVKAA